MYEQIKYNNLAGKTIQNINLYGRYCIIITTTKEFVIFSMYEGHKEILQWDSRNEEYIVKNLPESIVVGYGIMTSEEYKNINNEINRKRLQEQEDREAMEYERLKTKFENNQ